MTVTEQDLDNSIASFFELEAEIDAAEDLIKPKKKTLEDLKAQIAGHLKELNRKTYDSPAGRFTLVQKWRVNLPETLPDKLKLLDWLKEKGIYEETVTVNSNSLNSLYMQEWEAAKRNGEGMDFSIPGIGEPKLYETISKTKGKK